MPDRIRLRIEAVIEYEVPADPEAYPHCATLEDKVLFDVRQATDNPLDFIALADDIHVTGRAVRFRAARLSDAGFATGLYQGHCQKCDRMFVGDKRAFCCLPCAERWCQEHASVPVIGAVISLPEPTE